MARARGGGSLRTIRTAISSLLVYVVVIELGSAAVLAVTDWEWSIPSSDQPHLVYDVERQWKLRRSFRWDQITTNSHGFRGAELSFDKPPGTYRVVALGDSITFGTYDCPGDYCSDEDTYPRWLERALSRPDRPVEVLNGGTQGYNAAKARKWLSQGLSRYHADALIVLVGWNDILESSTASRASLRRNPLVERLPALRAADDWFRANSRAYRLAWLARKKIQGPPAGSIEATSAGAPPTETTIDPRAIADYEAELRAIVRIGRSVGMKIALLTIPAALTPSDPSVAPDVERQILAYYYWAELRQLLDQVGRFNEVVGRVGTSENAEVIDLAGIVARSGGIRLYRLPDINHPIHAALQQLTASLALELRARSVIP